MFAKVLRTEHKIKKENKQKVQNNMAKTLTTMATEYEKFFSNNNNRIF